MQALGIIFGGGGFNMNTTKMGAGGGQVGGIGTLGPNFGIPQRAGGGPVTAGRPHRGRARARVVRAGSSGTIYNQDQMRDATNAYSPGNSTNNCRRTHVDQRRHHCHQRHGVHHADQFRQGMDQAATAELQGEQRAEPARQCGRLVRRWVSDGECPHRQLGKVRHWIVPDNSEQGGYGALGCVFRTPT